MASKTGSDGDRDRSGFMCTWRPDGVAAATVIASGPIDQTSAPRLEAVIAQAFAHARLVLIDVHDATFVDAAGIRAIGAGAAQVSGTGARLAVVGATEAVLAALPEPSVGAQVEVLDLAPTGSRRYRESSFSGEAEGRIRPFDNPVNASVLTARTMAVAAQELWFQGDDGSLGTAWAPPGRDFPMDPGASIEVYFDDRGGVNGWRHPLSGLAVNQRRFDPRDASPKASIAACQGSCGVLWQAPAATRLTEHDERCLTCSGPLVLR
jgi:anti-anti-sigma factor